MAASLHDPSADAPACAVCLDDLEGGPLSPTWCGHRFHAECLSKWNRMRALLSLSRTLPLMPHTHSYEPPRTVTSIRSSSPCAAVRFNGRVPTCPCCRSALEAGPPRPADPAAAALMTGRDHRPSSVTSFWTRYYGRADPALNTFWQTNHYGYPDPSPRRVRGAAPAEPDAARGPSVLPAARESYQTAADAASLQRAMDEMDAAAMAQAERDAHPVTQFWRRYRRSAVALVDSLSPTALRPGRRLHLQPTGARAPSPLALPLPLAPVAAPHALAPMPSPSPAGE